MNLSSKFAAGALKRTSILSRGLMQTQKMQKHMGLVNTQMRYFAAAKPSKPWVSHLKTNPASKAARFNKLYLNVLKTFKIPQYVHTTF